MKTTANVAVVFDLGGVLLDWDPTYVLERSQIEALDIAGVQRELDLGIPLEQVRTQWHATFPGDVATIDHYLDNWHHTLPGALDATVAVLDELHRLDVRLYALSNFSGDLFRQQRSRFDFLDRFDGLLISGDEGLVKPDPAIFGLLIERFDLDPLATVFVDDRDDNVAGARDAGLHAIRFESAAQLRRDLAHLGVLPGHGRS
ncbi:MAG TPA: HAD family phosphatase [Euzebyales bacterium]